MGYYIDPEGMTKEAWLSANAEEVSAVPDWDEAHSAQKLPVCLVDNVIFTAAGVCFDRREHAEFSRPSDRRPKRWFVAPIRALVDVGAIPKTMLSESEGAGTK